MDGNISGHFLEKEGMWTPEDQLRLGLKIVKEMLDDGPDKEKGHGEDIFFERHLIHR